MNEHKDLGLHFNISVDQMHQETETVLASFDLHKPDLVARNPALADPWADTARELLDLAITTPRPATNKEASGEHTQEVKNALKEGQKFWQTEYKLYVMLAFKDKPGVLPRFKLKDFDKARKVPALLAGLFDQVHAVAVEHQAALVAKGWSVAGIGKLTSLAAELRGDKTAQQLSYSLNGEKKYTWTGLQNQVWEFRGTLADTAEAAFYGPEYTAIRRQFNRYLNRKPGPEKHEVSVEAGRGKNLPQFDEPLQSDTLLRLRLSEGDAAQVSYAEKAGEPGVNAIKLEAGQSLEVKAGELGSGPYLYVQNTGRTKARATASRLEN